MKIDHKVGNEDDDSRTLEVKNMRKRELTWLLSFIFMISLLSCAANMEKKRTQAKATRELGEAYMRQGDYTEALRELLKAQKIYPDDHLLQNDLGLVYMSKYRYDLAENHFRKAIQIKPDYAAAKNNLGTVYLAKKDWNSAIKTFKSLEENLLYATPHYPLSNLGLAYYKLEDYATAEKYYLKALEIEPNFIIAMRGLGRTYIALMKIPEAVSTLEKAVREAPTWAELYLDMGSAYRLSGEYTKALLAFHRVTQLAPDTPKPSSVDRRVVEALPQFQNRDRNLFSQITAGGQCNSVRLALIEPADGFILPLSPFSDVVQNNRGVEYDSIALTGSQRRISRCNFGKNFHLTGLKVANERFTRGTLFGGNHFVIQIPDTVDCSF